MRLLLASLLLATPLLAETPLRQQLKTIAADAKGKVSVACSLPGTPLDCNLNPHAHPPLQSVFKLPLGVAVLEEVETGRLQLDEPIHFLQSDTYPGTYSPLQDAHPDGNIDVPLRELLRLTLVYSDNTAADILLRILGGPVAVQRSLDALRLPTIHVRDSERALHDDQHLQYRNNAEPAAMVALLRRLADNSPLNAAHTKLLLTWMSDSPVGAHRIRAGLPAGTVLAHRTGTSGEKDGLAPATNDVGLITLPDGRRLALAIFVTDARADEATRDAVIARITRVIYDAATNAR